MAEAEHLAHRVYPEESPFAVPPIAGLPFKKDSEEALAIRRIIAEADEIRERLAADMGRRHSPRDY